MPRHFGDRVEVGVLAEAGVAARLVAVPMAAALTVGRSEVVVHEAVGAVAPLVHAVAGAVVRLYHAVVEAAMDLMAAALTADIPVAMVRTADTASATDLVADTLAIVTPTVVPTVDIPRHT